MQSPAQSGPGPATSVALSPIERSAFAHLFHLADPHRTGIVTGDAAVAFFSKSKLPPAILGQIWSIADSANNGFLTAPSFSTALRLIGHAQRGEPVNESVAKRSGPLPTMEGVTYPVTSQLTGTPSAATPAAATLATPATASLPGMTEIKPEDLARYTRIFATAGPVSGLLEGEKAKEIFVKSKLPFDKLGAIWNLADTQSRGALDLTDFIVAMHFIHNTMNGTLNSIPALLPAGLYEQAKTAAAIATRLPTLPGSPIASQTTGGSVGSTIPRQLTGQPFQSPSIKRTFSPVSPPVSAFQSSISAATTAPWDVTADEKLRSDQYFDGLDADKKGALDGAVVVPFFMQSKLNEAVLAHVWDFADITQSGSLNRDEFAVAMHLINAKLAGKDLPQELPQSLIPPHMRSMKPSQAANPQPTDTLKDLFSLMDDDPPAPTISAFIVPTNASSATAAPVGGVGLSKISSSTSTTASTVPTGSDAFDDDFFNQHNSTTQAVSPVVPTLSPAATGGSFIGARSPAGPGTPTRTGTSTFGLSGDQSAEFGNKTLQLQSTQKAVTDLQTRRAGLETAVNTNAASIAELETRLSTVRSQHEAESKIVQGIEARHKAQNEELVTLRQDVIREESALSALKAEKDELEQAVMRDREDVRDMKKKMADIQVETKSLKEMLEKLRKDARQQKGLVAISKKQLATAETEQEKLKFEIELAEKGETGLHLENEAIAVTGRDLPSPSAFGALSPATILETLLSPASSVKSTNPFERFSVSGSQPETPAATSGLPVGAVAAVGGAMATTAAVAAAVESSHRDSHDNDPFLAPLETRNAPTGFDDAFTVTDTSVAATAAPAQTVQDVPEFDDYFGDDFVAVATPHETGQTPSASARPMSTAFDDAFGSLDDEQPKDTVEPVTDVEPVQTAFDDAFVSSPTPQSGANEINPDAEQDQLASNTNHPDEHVNNHTNANEDDQAHVQDVNDNVNVNANTKDDTEDNDSSDKEEGPEEIDSYRPTSANDIADASERFPEIKPDDLVVSSSSDSPFGGEAEGQDRLMSNVFGTEVDKSVKPSSSNEMTAAAAPVDVTADVAGSDEGKTDSTNLFALQTSGLAVTDSDTLQDTVTDVAATSEVNDVFGAAATPEPNTTSAIVASDLQAETTVVSPTASDDDIPLAILSNKVAASNVDISDSNADIFALSPSSSTKTRRAPPPAPVRNQSSISAVPTATSSSPAVVVVDVDAGAGADATAEGIHGFESSFGSTSVEPNNLWKDTSKTDATANVASVSVSSNPFGADDFQTTTVSPSLQQQQNESNNTVIKDHNFDDFESAFEDLGQSETIAPPPAAAAPITGFDDAFDTDFDFIPSFGQSDVQQTVPTTSTAAAKTTTTSGFEDFDSTFDPPPHPPSATTITTTTMLTASPTTMDTPTLGVNSEFNFENAFETVPPPPTVPDRKSTQSQDNNMVSALLDDASPVKQLCGMGFPRNKVIQALERSNYNMEKALEKLLSL